MPQLQRLVRVSLLLGSSLLVASCTPIPPPPPVQVQRLAAPAPEGTISASLVATYGGGVFVTPITALELRIEHQTTAAVALGLGLPIAYRPGRDRPMVGTADCRNHRGLDACISDRQAIAPRWGVAGRLFVHWNPDSDRPWYAVTSGIGGGWVDSGLLYATADVGAMISEQTDDGEVGVYAAPVIAVSVPLRPGRGFGTKLVKPSTTWFVGLETGAVGRLNQARASISVPWLVFPGGAVYGVTASVGAVTD